MIRILKLAPGLLLGAVFSTAIAADLPRSTAPADAEVYIVSPRDGARICGPVRVVFGLRGMGVAPAGMERAGTGHHHLLINTPLPPAGLPVPSDEHHRHFGNGQTETLLELPPGEYTLQLLLADHLHIPHEPPVVSPRITITVEE